ncbi:MAG TPA: hypothetical protein VIJ53_04905 [Acidobacteriaceae bacterium]
MITQLFARLGGPMHFRFIMQPLMAAILATIDGIKDGKAGRPAYLWEMVSTAADRKPLLKEGWKRVSRVFLLAVVLDVIYQLIEFHWIYPGETLIVAIVLAIIPYFLIRGPVNRFVKWRIRRKLEKSNPGVAAS